MLKGVDLVLRLPARGALAGLAGVATLAAVTGRDHAAPAQRPPDDVELPRVVAGRWRRLERLGQGGFGDVWSGQCLKTGGPVALKFARRGGHERQLRREAAVLQALAREPGITRLLALHEQGGTACLVLTRSGQSLAAWRRSLPGRRLPAHDAARLSLQMLDAVQAVHRHGYVHGDVKNANCVATLTVDGPMCSLIDFGLTRPARDARAASPRVAGLVGTARYASLAVHAGTRPRPIDDLWSWFYSAAELLAGDLPWHGVTDAAALAACKRAQRGGPLLARLPPPLRAVEAALIDAESSEPPHTLLRQALLAALRDNQGN